LGKIRNKFKKLGTRIRTVRIYLLLRSFISKPTIVPAAHRKRDLWIGCLEGGASKPHRDSHLNHAMPRQFPVSPSPAHPHNICDLPSSVWNCICKTRRVHLQICTNSVAEHLGAQIGNLGWNFRSNNLRISKVRHETRNLLQELQTVYHDLQKSTTDLSPNLEPWQVR
jgi:hypothetical protein